jgi:hypothetical protein
MIDVLTAPDVSRQLARDARARVEAQHGARAWTERLLMLYAQVARDAGRGSQT